MTDSLSLPTPLIESMRNHRVIPFLGAGASMEAVNKEGRHPPSADQLRQLLGQRFFGQPMDGYDLTFLSEMAIQAHGQALVFEYIRDTLAPFPPPAAHFLLPTFRWRALATTNYDTLIDDAYARTTDRLQTIIPFVKDTDPVEDRMQRASNPLPYLKLHGCINHLHDHDIPLILSHEHYSKYDTHRKHLYSRLRAWAHESTFLFCGYKLGDAHIRKIIYELAGDGVKRPTWYLVTPNIADYEIQFWASLNIHVIPAHFGLVMSSLDTFLSPASRILSLLKPEHDEPIRSHFITQEETPTRLRSALERDLLYIHSDMPIEPQDSKDFYQGFDTGWGVVSQELDVSRKPVGDLLLDAVIDHPSDPVPQLYVFTGPAGAGKTIALKRAAWEAATSMEAICLWLCEGGVLDDEVILDLHRLTGQRIFVFVDRLAHSVDPVIRLLSGAKQKRTPITVVGSERLNEWNLYCEPLQQICQTTELPIHNLSASEIAALLDLLTRHSALGLLTGESRDKQISAFTERAERQLLVALHEATLGKPFESIIHDEYLRIEPDTARQLYLDVCTMHQYNVSARAGTISRISGIQFDDFTKRFFTPLEKVVLTSTDPYTGDYHYRARHARIAQLVFQQARSNDKDRADQLIRIVSSLDIGYAADHKALEGIVHGHDLARDIRQAEVGRGVFLAALETAPDAAFILQQWAIFEANHSQGLLDEAEELIRRAAERDPRAKSIKHTRAVICRKKANAATSMLAKTQYRRLAREQLDEMRSKTDPYVLNLRVQLAIDELSDIASSLGDSPTESQLADFRDTVERTEAAVNRASQLLPDDAELLQAVARLNRLLSRHEMAIRALERSWQVGPRGSSVAVQLANHYASKKDDERSLQMLQSALDRDPSDHRAHLEMAKYLFRVEPDRREVIDQHFMRSYAANDQRFEARHLHAQYLFLIGRSGDSRELFTDIDRTAPARFRRRAEERDSIVSAQLHRHHGTIVTLKATMAFVTCSSYPADIFGHANDSEQDVWRTLRSGDAITFKVSFNRAGPVAKNVEHQAN